MGNKPAGEGQGQGSMQTRSRASSSARSGSESATSTPSRERKPSKATPQKKPFSKYEEPLGIDSEALKIDVERLVQDLKQVSSLGEDPIVVQLALVWQCLLANSSDHVRVSDENLSECREHFNSKYFHSAMQTFGITNVDQLDDFVARVCQRLKPRDRRPKPGQAAAASISSTSSSLPAPPPNAFQCNFHDFYLFVFNYGLNDNAKVLEKDVALYLWRGIMKDRTPHLAPWCDYLEHNYPHGITLDTWKCFLEFIETVHGDLSNYDPEGAWPTVMDDYYSYRRTHAN